MYSVRTLSRAHSYPFSVKTSLTLSRTTRSWATECIHYWLLHHHYNITTNSIAKSGATRTVPVEAGLGGGVGGGGGRGGGARDLYVLRTTTDVQFKQSIPWCWHCFALGWYSNETCGVRQTRFTVRPTLHQHTHPSSPL